MCEKAVLLWYFLLLAVFPAARTTPCERLKIPADVVDYNSSSFVVGDDCDCGVSGCVRKCCADGFGVYVHLNERTCNRTVSRNFSAFLDGVGNLDYFTGFMSCPSYLLEPEVNEEDVFSLQPDGRLWLKEGDVYHSVQSYCVDYVDTVGFTGFVCFKMEELEEAIFRQFKEISKLIFAREKFYLQKFYQSKNENKQSQQSN